MRATRAGGRRGHDGAQRRARNGADEDDGDGAAPRRCWPRADRVAAQAALAAISVLAHARTAPVGLGGGDSGELAANACSFGVAHPPGYPLLMVLGHIWLRATAMLAPAHASPAARLHALNVVLAHLGLQVLAATIRLVLCKGFRETNRAICTAAAVAGTAIFALTPIVWEFSSTFEVFALNNLLCSLLLFLTARALLGDRRESVTPRKSDRACAQVGNDHDTTLCQGALVCGLALANQHTAVLFVAPLVGIVLYSLWLPLVLQKQTRWAAAVSLVRYACFFFCGLALYGQSVWSAVAVQAQGSWGDAGSLHGLARHFLRADYGTLQLFPGGGSAGVLGDGPNAAGNLGWAERTQLYLEALAYESLPGVGALAIAALGVLHSQCAEATCRRVDLVGLAWFSALAFSLTVFHALSNMPILDAQPHLAEIRKRFWQQPQLIVGLFFGLGVHGGLRALIKFRNEALRQRPWPSRVIAYTFIFAIPLLWLGHCTVAWTSKTYAQLSSRAHSGTMDQIAVDVLNGVPHGGVLFTRGDMEWTGIQYLQRCTGARPDVTVVSTDLVSMPWFSTHLERYPVMEKAHVGDTARKLIDTQTPFAFTGREEDWASVAIASDGTPAPRLRPEGLLQVHRPPGAPRAVPFWTAERIDKVRALVHEFARPGDGGFSGTWEWMAALRMFQRGKKFFESQASMVQSQEVVLASPNATAEHMLACARGLQRLLADGLTNWHQVSDEDETAMSDMNIGIMLLRAGELVKNPLLISQAMHLFASALRESKAGRAPRVEEHPSRPSIERILNAQDFRGGNAYFGDT